MTNDELQQKALKVVVLSQLLSEAMDDIKGTTLYKAKIKQHGNILSNLILSIARQTDNIYKEDPTMTTNIFNNLDNLVGQISKLDVNSMLMLNQIYEHYKDNKTDWESVFGVEMVKLQE